MIVLLLADGFEEIEALTPVDMLRRAGADIVTASVSESLAVRGSHGITVVADMLAQEVDESEVDALILPGGMPGSLNLDASAITDRLIDAVNKKGGRLAAICAAPLVLGKRGLLAGREAICYPGFESELKGARISENAVVTDGNITTAKGMGAALPFAEELVSLLVGDKTSKKLSGDICKA